jgi:hypothetical protein
VADYNEYVNNYDLDGLDKLYNEITASGLSEEKQKLADEGFLKLFHWMDYDFSCGKLTEYGTESMLSMVDKSEILLNKKLWYYRGRALSNLMEVTPPHMNEKAEEYAASAINAYRQYISEGGDFVRYAWSHLADIYDTLAKRDNENLIEHWNSAIECLCEAIDIHPFEAPWVHYLKLLYCQYNGSNDMFDDVRHNERKRFNARAHECASQQQEFASKLASDYHRFAEHIEWNKLPSDIFPEKEYLEWLEKGKHSEGSANYLFLSETAHLYFNEGKRLKRKDLLVSALDRYRTMMEYDDNKSFPVLYMCNTMEELHRLAADENDTSEAAVCLDRAQQFFSDSYELIKNNFSVLVQYGEFLERCAFEYSGNHVKPDLEKIIRLAILAEDESKGYYSAPGLLRARCALRMGKKDEAVFHMTRLLILFELCMEDEFRKILNNPLFSSENDIRDFLNENLNFMDSIRDGYYIDSTLPWNILETLTPQQLAARWQERRIELQARGKQQEQQ